MSDQNDDTPKIIVDDDWKDQARREQAEQDEMTREMPAADEMPPPSILEIVQMVLMQASVGLGLMQDPQTGQPIPPNLPLAKHYIDLLELLNEKTADRLEEAEKTQMTGALHQLRMVFVELSTGQPPSPASPASPAPPASEDPAQG